MKLARAWLIACALLALPASAGAEALLHDPKTGLTLGPTRDWALHGDPYRSADLECLFETCEGIPSSVRRKFCLLSLEDRPGSNLTPERLPRAFPREKFARAAENLVARSPDLKLALDGEPKPEQRKSGLWLRASILGSTPPGRTVEGAVLTTARGSTVLTMTCAFAERDWAAFGAKLDALADTLTWSPKAPK